MKTYAVVDKLGCLLAEQAELARQIKACKEELIELGDNTYEGDLFSATVFHSVSKKMDKASTEFAFKLAAFSDQYLAAHTITSEKDTVKVTAKIADKVAA